MADYLTTTEELTSIADAIREKGGTEEPLEYPEGFVDAIEDISGGGGSAIAVTETADSHGGTVLSISGVSLAGDTVKANRLLKGYTAHDASGNAITGTYEGGSEMNIQVYNGYDYVTSTSYTATDVTLKVAATGTYTITWVGWRSSNSGTSGSQLYKNGTAVGTAVTSFTGTYGQVVTLTNQSLNEGDVLVVYARSRGSTYYMYVANLMITQTA